MAPPIFDTAAITLGIGPHSTLCSKKLDHQTHGGNFVKS